MAKLRLDKYLADMQLGTRSEVKELIKKRRIKVNGTQILTPDFKLDTAVDLVTFDNQAVNYQEYEYYMLNKPQGVVSATRDANTSTVLDLISGKKRKDLFPVGRLDKDTEGLLLITNNGVLAHELLSPKKHVDKTYYAKVSGCMGQDIITAFAKGLQVDEKFTAMPAVLEVLTVPEDSMLPDCYSEVRITIREGKFHQIKRMFEAVGSEVLYLKRLSMGTLQLDPDLKPGEYRTLTKAEITALQERN